MAKGFNLKAIFSADTKDIERGSARATESVRRFDRDSKAALDEFAGRTEVAGKKAQIFGKNIGALAVRFAAAAVSVRSFVSTIKTIATFEKANSTLAAILGTTAAKIKNLTDSAIELGRKTEYTATQVTELQTELAKLGFSEPQIISMQESVLKFAAAVGTDLASAAARAGATMRGFDLTADETSDLLAVMAVSTSKSALSFDYLDETLGKVIPVTKSFGIDARGTTALLGAMANAGIDASSAGTALRRIMAELANSGSKLNKTLGKQPRTMEEVIAALKQLRDSGVGVTEAFELVGKYSGATFLALVNGADDVATLYGELQNVDTALNDMYDTMTDNVEGAVKRLQSAWEALILSFRQSQGTIKTVLNLVTSLVSEFNRVAFRQYRESEAESNYRSILGGILKRDGMDAVGEFVSKEINTLQAEISRKTQRMQKAMQFGWLGLWNASDAKDDINQLYSMLQGLQDAYASIQEQALRTGDTIETVPPAGGLSGGEKVGSKSAKHNGLADLQREAREYAAAEQEVIDADREMAEEGRRLYEQYRALHPVFNDNELDVSNIARNVAKLVEMDQEAGSATNVFAEKLYDLGDAFQSVVYAAGLTDEQLTEDVNRLFDEWSAGLEAMKEVAQEFSDEVSGILEDAFVDSFSNLGTYIGNALTGGTDAASEFSSAMLSTLADMAIRVGELAISTGVAVAGIKAALESMNPYVAIAAGAALVLLGSAVKAGLSNISKGGGYSSTSISSSYGSSSGYGSDNYATRDINIRVTGRLIGTGSTLIGVIDSENNRQEHTT